MFFRRNVAVKIQNKLFSMPGVVLHTACIMAWLSNLVSTDSMVSIYVLCALIGIFALCSNYFRKPVISGKACITLLYSAFLFSVATILANYRLFSGLSDPLTLFNMGCTFLGGIVLAYDVMLCVFDRLPYCVLSDSPHKYSAKTCFFVFFISIIVIDLIYLFFVQYPGIMTNDSYTQVRQILSGEYTNHHPFWHTMIIKLCYSLALFFTDDINLCATLYAILQAVFLAACFAYSLTTMYQLNMPGRLIFMAWFVFALMPYNIAFSICMNKDYMFSGAVLAFSVSFYRLLKDVGASRFVNYVIFVLSGLGCCVWRSNGFIAYVICIAVFLLFCRKFRWKLLALMTAVAAFGWIMTNPMLASFNISQPDLVESLSIPVQQVARVIYDGCDLSEEDYALISRVVDIEEISELYTDWLSDPVKDEIRSKDNAYFEAHRAEYFDLWVRLGLQYPWEYVKAWVDQTKGYWNGGYDYYIYALGVSSNDLGFTDGINSNFIAKIVNLIFKFCRGAIFMEPFESIGLHVWLVYILLIVNWLKGRQEMFLSVLPLAVVVTLLIATPVYSAFRYAYPVFTTYPFILAVSICKSKEM